MQISSASPAYPLQRPATTPGAAIGREEEKTSAESARNNGTKLSDEEQKQLSQLQARDREVRAHEAAHKAAAGQYATGAASFEYQRGPDGRLYASGGEVGIDTSPIAGNPAATIQKANQVRAAALAPAQPSGQDMAVAAAAAMMAATARSEMLTQQQRPATEQTEQGTPSQQAQLQQYQSVANGSDNPQPPLIHLTA